MISLGTYDETVSKEALAEYQKYVIEITQATALAQWKQHLREEGKWVEYSQRNADDEITVKELQQFLRDADFLPFAKIDGICGYRTAGAIFLFQEYIRTVEGKTEIGFPDGKFGKVSLSHVRRWQADHQRADWSAFSGANPSPEYQQWMKLLAAYKAQCLENPSATLKKVNAAGTCDTLKVADWDFDPAKIHLIGIRHRKSPQAGAQSLDDVYKLLIHGVVFTFYGSTEPGTKEGSKYPFLVPGQHRYRFGLHKQSDQIKVFHALRPLGKGVWVQRSANLIPTDADLSGPLDGPNPTINVHWGGEGLTDSAAWSAGCQVIAGKSYINHHGKVIDCSQFAASGYAGLGAKDAKGVYLSKGAYSVLEDLVAAFSGANPDDNIVRYTLLNEADLALNPEISLNQIRDSLQQLKS
ncbi:MAG: hypothetical protein JST84_06750 [Acidobacteria bacterium]|nr:hypothetical protein [Acidobacteriota bacterium]